MLESYGIPARLSYNSFGRILGMVGDGLGVTALQVPEDRVEEAREFLKASSREE
jgi:hypothetical protein